MKGMWIDDPPYWFPDCNPNVRIFDESATTKCMQNRTLYVIGNSVARQSAFGLVDMLGGGNVKREGQRDMCPKHETTWGDSCHKEFGGVKIRYLFLTYIDGFYYGPNPKSEGQIDRGGFPFLLDTYFNKSKTKALPPEPNAVRIEYGHNEDIFWAEDNCINKNVRSCLREFFSDSKQEDVLMFTIGMAYAQNSGIIDVDSWARSSTAAFRSHIDSTFKGKVFRVTLAPYGPKMSYASPSLKHMNNIIWDLTRPGSEERDEMWYTIDQWEINTDRGNLYNDHVHYVGPLTIATLTQMLNVVCPSEGKNYSKPNVTEVMSHHEGHVVKSYSGTHGIFFVKNGTIHWVPNLDTLWSLGFKEKDIDYFTDEIMNAALATMKGPDIPYCTNC